MNQKIPPLDGSIYLDGRIYSWKPNGMQIRCQHQPSINANPRKRAKGNKYLRAALIEVAYSVCRSDNYLGVQYRRIAARKGRHRAAVAVAHSITAIVHHLLTRKEDYKDLGSHYFEQHQQEAIVRQAVRRLENLGFQVALSTSEAS